VAGSVYHCCDRGNWIMCPSRQFVPGNLHKVAIAR
jgi:hypothetical protein